MSADKLSARKNGKKDKIVVEKAEAEELPPGWTKDARIRKNGSKIRKDLYYKDPVTGCTFRSLKDVQRYLKSGELGRLAIKPKDDGYVDMDVEDENLPTQAGGNEPKLPEKGTDDQMAEQQSSSLVEMKNDEKIVESTSVEDHACVSGSASEPCNETAEGGNVNLPRANGSEEKEGKEITALRDVDLFEANGLEEREKNNESEEQMIVSTPSSENSQHKRSLESKSEGNKKRNKSSEKIKSTLPRRASKRLAGIKVDVPSPPPPPPEPKTRRQATTRWTREAKASTTANVAAPTERDEKAAAEEPTSREKQVDPTASSEVERKIKLKDKQETILPLAREPGGKIDMDNKPNEKQEVPILSPPANLSTMEESCEKDKKEDIKADVKQESTLVTPSAPKEHEKEIKTDSMPKKTQMLPTALPLTSLATTVVPPVSLETEMDDKPHEKQGSTVVTPPMCLPIQEDNHGGPKTDIKPASPVNFSLNDLWTDPCIEFAVKTLTGDIPTGEEKKVDNVLPSPLELPLEELWTDPCIEFAVKTLTGAIPVGEVICVQDYSQHQATSSSDTRGESSFSFPDAGTNNFCQTEVLSKHFEVAENPLHNKQQDPTLIPNGGNSNRLRGLGGGSCSRKLYCTSENVPK